MNEQANMSKSEDRGSCHVVVYLYDFTDAEVERLMERIGDVLTDEMGVVAGADDPVRALIASRPEAFPVIGGSDEADRAFLAKHTRILVLNTEEGDDA